MSYVNKHLIPGESVVREASVHWIVFLPGFMWILTGIVLVVIVSPLETIDSGFVALLRLLAMLMALIGFFSIIKAMIYRWTTELAVTSRRVVAKWGLIKRDTIELNHSKVESFIVHQSIPGRLLNYGTLIVQGTGGGSTPIVDIAEPLSFRSDAMAALDG
ncbi:MAG: PH domain-containing protein [Gammaproteobacteria bacterium]